MEKDEWQRFAHFDPHKNYTRNLIATDHKTYTVLLLCWNPQRESPIHDHPCDGCWMRVLQGGIRECRYVEDESSPEKLTCFQDKIYDEEGGVVFIEDSQGYHKIGDASKTAEEPAVSIHLYSPPFSKCKIFLDASRNKPSQTHMCNYSEYGEKVDK